MRFIFFFILYIIAVLVQFSWSQYFDVQGLAPNVILVLVVFIGLLRGSMTGQLFGFLIGLTWDVLSVEFFGSHALMLTIIGFLTGKLNRKWDEKKLSSQVVLVLAVSFFYWFGMTAIMKIFEPDAPHPTFNFINYLQPFYNALIAPVVFWGCSFIMEFSGIFHDKSSLDK